MPSGAWHIAKKNLTHCKHGHEFTEENTYWVGTGRQCKACKHNRMIQWQKDNKGKDFSHRPKIILEKKFCPVCKTTKSINSFSPNKLNKDLHSYRCRDCFRIYSNKRYHANSKTHYERAKAYYERHPETRRESLRKYKQANKHLAVGYAAKRRAWKRGNGFEDVDILIVFERDKGICHICKQLVDKNRWHLDHIIPLSKGGPHTYSNVAVAHPSCNLSKNNKLIT